MYLYFYKSYGLKIPGIWKGKLKDLQIRFEGSITPLWSVQKVTKENKKGLQVCLTAWYHATDIKEIGLADSLSNSIKQLKSIK